MSSDNDDYTAFKKTLNETNNQFILRQNTKDLIIQNELSLNDIFNENSNHNTLNLDQKRSSPMYASNLYNLDQKQII